MTKLALIGAACLAASTLSACSTLESGLNSAANFIDQPNVQQAAATVKTVGKALVCTVAAGSAAALKAEVLTGHHTSVTADIYVATSIPCDTLGGSLTGATASNVPAVTAVSQ